MNNKIKSFDEVDTFILANRFSVKMLRHEAHQSDIRTSVAETYRNTVFQIEADLFPWADYSMCCKEAINWKLNSYSKNQIKSVIGQVDTESIKAKNDIAVIVEQYTMLRKTGRNFTGCCPIHGDKHPSFTVYPDQQSWHCFGCNRGGDVIAFIQVMENTDFRGAATILGGV